MSEKKRNSVRIIGGDFRRRCLSFPDSEGLRPTPDRVRETLFNWLGQDLQGKACLDLFAGSGALGFEAASRHAQCVVMVETAGPVLSMLKKNKNLLGASTVNIVALDACRYLQSTHERFDVVFLDPPYADKRLPQVLPLLRARLNPNALVYCEAGEAWDFLGWEWVRNARGGGVCYGLLRPVIDEAL